MPVRRSEIVSALLSCGALFVAVPARAACPGAFDGWSNATPIDFDNKSAAQTNHLALLPLDTSNLVTASKLKADGGDLRFADGSCRARTLRERVERDESRSFDGDGFGVTVDRARADGRNVVFMHRACVERPR